MSFSSDVKEELSTRIDMARHCQIAEFAAIMGMSGRIRRASGKRLQKLPSPSKVKIVKLFRKCLNFILKAVILRELLRER